MVRKSPPLRLHPPDEVTTQGLFQLLRQWRTPSASLLWIGGTRESPHFPTHKWNGHSSDTWHRETWRFVAGKVDASSIEKGSISEIRASGTFSTSGTALSIHFTCPQDMQMTVQYSATATTLTTFNAGDPNETHTFTKQ